MISNNLFHANDTKMEIHPKYKAGSPIYYVVAIAITNQGVHSVYA